MTLQATPTTMDFGTVPSGQIEQRNIILESDVPATVSSIAKPSWITVSPVAPFDIIPLSHILQNNGVTWDVANQAAVFNGNAFLTIPSEQLNLGNSNFKIEIDVLDFDISSAAETYPAFLSKLNSSSERSMVYFSNHPASRQFGLASINGSAQLSLVNEQKFTDTTFTGKITIEKTESWQKFTVGGYEAYAIEVDLNNYWDHAGDWYVGRGLSYTGVYQLVTGKIKSLKVWQDDIIIFDLGYQDSQLVNKAAMKNITFSYSPESQNDTGNVILNYDGGETLTVAVSGAMLAPPSYSLSLSSISFSDTIIEETSSTQFLVNNTGGSSITVNITSPTGFSILDSVPFSLPQGESKIINVVFSPVSVQQYSGDVVISVTGLTDSVVAVTGKGIAAPTRSYSVDSQLSFGKVVIGKNKSLPITINNTGELSIDIASFLCTDGFSFSREFPFTILAGEHCTCGVEFKPTEKQSYIGSITVNAENLPVETVTAQGEGIEQSDVVFSAPTPPGTYWKHKIIEGDRIDRIAWHYYNDSGTVEKIFIANPWLKFSNDISEYVGEEIYIPVVKAENKAEMPAKKGLKRLLWKRENESN